MTAELASLGTHCAFCGSLDFLPIPCTACDQRFCRVHAPVDAHACASTPSLVVLPSAPAADPVAELRAAHTPAVVSRGASGEKDAKREAALAVLAVLARNFPAKPASAGTAKAPMRKPLSRKLVIMKLRQRATSADPRKSAGDVPVAERLHLEVKCEGREAALWIAKDVTAGRALDLFAAALGIKNVNNMADAAQHLSLSVVNNDGLPGPPFSMQQPLSQTTLQDGDTMMLLRGSVISV